MKCIFWTFIVLLFGCGTFRPSKNRAESPNLFVQIKAKADLYTELMEINGHRDENGFIMTDHCDATWFSGLLSAALGDMPNYMIIKDENGKFWRRPNRDCGPSFNNSRSSISRDMMLGVFYHFWYNKDLESAIELMDQLKSTAYFLKGEGTPGELFMIPAYMRTLADIIDKLGGPKYTFELNLPATFGKDGGYVAHLTVWHILLRGSINGSINSLDLDVLKHHVNRSPLNPLFQAAYHKYADGNMTKAIRLLLNNEEWPSSKLPTTKEHCDDWPIQRDYTPNNWGSCSSEKEHTGAELVVLYHLLLKDRQGNSNAADGP